MSRVIKSPFLSGKVRHVPEPTSAVEGSGAGEQGGGPLDREAQARQRLQEAERKARTLIEQAQGESDGLVAEARSEAKRLKDLAWEEGLNEGRRQGQQELEAAKKEQVEHFERSVRTLLESMQAEKERLIRKAEPQLIDLACAIAGRIVRKEVEQDSSTVLSIVQKAIDLATAKDQLLIRLNPADIEWVREHSGQLMASHDELGEIHFEQDPRIERGGCIIETKVGNVDARLERQLGELRRNLRESV